MEKKVVVGGGVGNAEIFSGSSKMKRFTRVGKKKTNSGRFSTLSSIQTPRLLLYKTGVLIILGGTIQNVAKYWQLYVVCSNR